MSDQICVARVKKKDVQFQIPNRILFLRFLNRIEKFEDTKGVCK